MCGVAPVLTGAIKSGRTQWECLCAPGNDDCIFIYKLPRLAAYIHVGF